MIKQKPYKKIKAQQKKVHRLLTLELPNFFNKTDGRKIVYNTASKTTNRPMAHEYTKNFLCYRLQGQI